MTKFKYENKIIYIEDEETQSQKIIHYVADTHFKVYIEKRKRAPNLCKLFDKVKDRNNEIEKLMVLV